MRLGEREDIDLLSKPSQYTEFAIEALHKDVNSYISSIIGVDIK